MYRNILLAAALMAVIIRIIPYSNAQNMPPDIRIPTDKTELIEWVKTGVHTVLTTTGIDLDRFKFFDEATNWVLEKSGNFNPNDLTNILTGIWDQLSNIVFQGIQIARGGGFEGLLTEGIRFTRGLFDAGVGLMNSITQ